MSVSWRPQPAVQSQGRGAWVGGQRGLHAQDSATRAGGSLARHEWEWILQFLLEAALPAPQCGCRKAARTSWAWRISSRIHCLTWFVHFLRTAPPSPLPPRRWAKVGLKFSNPGRSDCQNSSPPPHRSSPQCPLCRLLSIGSPGVHRNTWHWSSVPA